MNLVFVFSPNIDIHGARPIKHAARRMSTIMRQIVIDTIKALLEKGFIEKSTDSKNG